MSDSFGTDESDGWLGGLVADEDSLDRRTLWRLGLWGAAAVCALTLGLLSGQLPVTALRTQLAAHEVASHARQVEASIHDNQLEAKRLAAAIETLNTDRDRLFNRLSSIEQGLDVVTGSIKKADEKPATTPWPDAATARIIDTGSFMLAPPPQTTPTPAQTTAVAVPPPAETERAAAAAPARNEPVPAPAETSTQAAAPPAAATTPPPVVQAMPIPDPQPGPEQTDKAIDETPVAAVEFGVDLGSANSIDGLRALWRGLVKSHKTQLEGLRPLIAVQERRNGLGLQLRLVAGPIRDAATVARICAVLDNANRDCKTSSFDGQRLSLATTPQERVAPARPAKPRRSTHARHPKEEAPQTTAERQSALSTMLGIR